MEGSVRKAIEHYQQATEIDPTYAPAYAGLASGYYTLGSWWGSLTPTEARAKAKEAALKALERDRSLPEAHMALGMVKHLFEWDWAGAGTAFRSGMELNPRTSFARIDYANYLTAMGRFEESIAIGRQTLEIDPLSPAAYNELAWALDYAGRDTEALEYYRKGLELEPNFAQTHALLGGFYLKRGRLREAITYWQKTESLLGDNRSASLIALVAHGYARAGRPGDALQILNELKKRAEKQYVPATAMAMVYLGLGEKEQALKWLEKAYEQHAVDLVWLKVDWMYDPLRSDPRFQDLLRRMNFPR